ncbi:MAG: type II toxin-antitoxin system RelE/ParE family toxin [Deltaproteobacteria bacterium]|nr:type II toxin-antitoxin system RelE/ParE family toxin [Deltaproteobacteria bacterium]
MTWKIEYTETAQRQLAGIDRQAAKNITRYLDERVATDEDPRRFGDPLKKDLSGLWKYRVGAFRVIVAIQEDRIVVLVVRIGHRSNVYAKPR